MSPALVPPDTIARGTIIATTKPNSLTRKIKLALYDLGIGKRRTGFPFVLWLKKRDKSEK
jgi:hypothetical protein